MPLLHVSSTCAHHQEVKIALHSPWYQRGLSQPVHETATYRCDDTRGCVMQFWPPDDEHMCSKHVEAWNKIIVKQKFCVSSLLITEINGTCLFRTVFLRDFKRSPCSVCCIISFGWFPGAWILYADVSEHCQVHRRRWCRLTPPYTTETSAYKIHTLGNHPKERILFSSVPT